jgi:hypothetical protein
LGWGATGDEWTTGIAIKKLPDDILVLASGSPIDVLATGAAISTAGVLVFKGGPDGSKLLKAFAAGEWRTVELLNDPASTFAN